MFLFYIEKNKSAQRYYYRYVYLNYIILNLYIVWFYNTFIYIYINNVLVYRQQMDTDAMKCVTNEKCL